MVSIYSDIEIFVVSVSSEKLHLTLFCSERDGSQDARGNYRERGSASQWPTWGHLRPQMETIKTVSITHCYVLFRGSSCKIVTSLFYISSFFKGILPKFSALKGTVSTLHMY